MKVQASTHVEALGEDIHTDTRTRIHGQVEAVHAATEHG